MHLGRVASGGDSQVDGVGKFMC